MHNAVLLAWEGECHLQGSLPASLRCPKGTLCWPPFPWGQSLGRKNVSL